MSPSQFVRRKNLFLLRVAVLNHRTGSTLGEGSAWDNDQEVSHLCIPLQGRSLLTDRFGKNILSNCLRQWAWLERTSIVPPWALLLPRAILFTPNDNSPHPRIISCPILCLRTTFCGSSFVSPLSAGQDVDEHSAQILVSASSWPDASVPFLYHLRPSQRQSKVT